MVLLRSLFMAAVALPLAFGAASAEVATPGYGYDDVIDLKVSVHVQNKGDLYYGEDEWAGSKGESLRLEGFKIKIDEPYKKRPKGIWLEYKCTELTPYVPYYPHDTKYQAPPKKSRWVKEGYFCGTKGQSKALDSFAVRVAGPQAKKYNVYYNCHVQDVGDGKREKVNGAYCGTKGKRLEAILVYLEKK